MFSRTSIFSKISYRTLLIVLCICSIAIVFILNSFLHSHNTENDPTIIVRVELQKRIKTSNIKHVWPSIENSNKNSNDNITLRSEISYRQNLNIFDEQRFYQEQHQDVQAPNTCIKSSVKPQFTICVYEMKQDIYVSSGILRYGIWEKEISELIKDTLLRFDPRDIVFLDVGANLGFHSLYAAKLGYKVWAIEPQQRNVIKIYRSAMKSGISNKLTIVQNAVAEVRRNGVMNIDDQNNGGSFLEVTNNRSKSKKMADIFPKVKIYKPCF